MSTWFLNSKLSTCLIGYWYLFILEISGCKIFFMVHFDNFFKKSGAGDFYATSFSEL